MTWLSQLMDKIARKMPCVRAPRRQLLHSGAHPVVPFHLILEEHQSNYFYTRGQAPALAVHDAGTHLQDPERIPATHYLVINRELEEAVNWEAVRVLDNYVIQLNFNGVVKVADADLLAKRFAQTEHQNTNTFIAHYLEKVSVGCAEQPSVADYQRAADSVQQYFRRNLETVMAQFGVALVDFAMHWKLSDKKTPISQAAAPTPSALGSLPVSVSHQTLAANPVPVSTLSAPPKPRDEKEAYDYYYFHQGERRGPIAANVIIQKIQAGELAANTVVWRSGMGGWVAANQFFTALL